MQRKKANEHHKIVYVIIKCSNIYERLITGHTAKVQKFSGILGSDNVIKFQNHSNLDGFLLVLYFLHKYSESESTFYIIQLQ